VAGEPDEHPGSVEMWTRHRIAASGERCQALLVAASVTLGR